MQPYIPRVIQLAGVSSCRGRRPINGAYLRGRRTRKEAIASSAPQSETPSAQLRADLRGKWALQAPRQGVRERRLGRSIAPHFDDDKTETRRSSQDRTNLNQSSGPGRGGPGTNWGRELRSSKRETSCFRQHHWLSGPGPQEPCMGQGVLWAGSTLT